MIFRVTIQNSSGDIISRRLKIIADTLVKRLQHTTPGKPAAKWSSKVGTDSAHVTNPAGYLRYLDEGTGIYGPHNAFIYPKKGKVLHWTEDGNDVFVTRVKGIKPRRFISAAIQEARQ